MASLRDDINLASFASGGRPMCSLRHTIGLATNIESGLPSAVLDRSRSEDTRFLSDVTEP